MFDDLEFILVWRFGLFYKLTNILAKKDKESNMEFIILVQAEICKIRE
jgi:hypothetical protein